MDRVSPHKGDNNEQVVIAIGWSTSTCERLGESEPVTSALACGASVDDVEGFGFVFEMMLFARSGLIFFCSLGIKVINPFQLTSCISSHRAHRDI